jgi:hypothetical protein
VVLTIGRRPHIAFSSVDRRRRVLIVMRTLPLAALELVIGAIHLHPVIVAIPLSLCLVIPTSTQIFLVPYPYPSPLFLISPLSFAIPPLSLAPASFRVSIVPISLFRRYRRRVGLRMRLRVFGIDAGVARRRDDFGGVEFFYLLGECFFLAVITTISIIIDEIPYCSSSVNFFQFPLHLLLIGPFDVLLLIPLPDDGSMAFVGGRLIGVPVYGHFALHVVQGCVGEGVRNSMYILRRST